MMKILAIGNSFSQDACAYIHQIAESAGIETKIVNLYIGGCPLERHVQNITEDAAAYSYELNGNVHTGIKISIKDALLEEEWDYVTMQQSSPKSGFPESYHPFLDTLSEYVKQYAPNAKQIIHETWAYEATTQSGAYSYYGRNQVVMYGAVTAAYHEAADHLGVDIIRVGELIQALRSDAAFDIKNGGIALTRDGNHLSIPYGRYAAGALWFEKLIGGDITKTSFIPEGADTYLINRIKPYVKNFKD